MAGNSGESKMGANQKMMAINQRDPIRAILQGIRVVWPASFAGRKPISPFVDFLAPKDSGGIWK